MNKRMGRPPEGRTIKVGVLFTKEEKETLEKVAKKTGLSYSKIILLAFSNFAAQKLVQED